MSAWLQLLLGGLVAGCAYLLIGLSWNVVYNACGYLNLAVGQFFVLAAIVADELQQRAPGWHPVLAPGRCRHRDDRPRMALRALPAASTRSGPTSHRCW